MFEIFNEKKNDLYRGTTNIMTMNIKGGQEFWTGDEDFEYVHTQYK